MQPAPYTLRQTLISLQGYQRLSQGVWGWLQKLLLPCFALSAVYCALIARITRTSVQEVLGEDYIRTAHSKGLTNQVVLMRHALRNAAVPIVTVIGIGIAQNESCRMLFYLFSKNFLNFIERMNGINVHGSVKLILIFCAAFQLHKNIIGSFNHNSTVF